ncbi:MAG TPA: TonB-dependent receptor [Opitutaceae bacterium]
MKSPVAAASISLSRLQVAPLRRRPGFRRLAAVWAALLAASAQAQRAVPALPREPAASLAPSFSQLHDPGRGLTTAPYDRLGRDELRQTGYPETATALSAALPTVNRPHFAIEDGTAHLGPFTLRGLSPDHTLVLVNGHRRPATPLLNVNGTIGRGSVSTSLRSVPLASLDAVEVLRDGSDARFGSGAIAGVINLRLAEDIGSRLQMLWGQTSAGDGEVKQVVFGLGGILGRDGVISVTAMGRDSDATDRAEPDTRQQYIGTAVGSGAPVPLSGAVGSGTGAPPAGVVFDPREATADRHAQRYGDAASHEATLVINTRLPLSPQSEFYAFGDFMRRQGESAVFYRRPGDSRVVRALWPDGFQPLLESRILSWYIAAGQRGHNGPWAYDASLSFGDSTIAYDVDQTNNSSYGAQSPRRFYAGKQGYSELTGSFELSRQLTLGLAKPASLGFGLEYRRENFRTAAGEDASWRNGGVLILDGPDAGRAPSEGSQGFPGFRPGDAVDVVREVGGVDVELSQQIGQRLRLSVSGRSEFAKNIEATRDAKVGGFLELWGGLAVRGSAGSTYRLPHLAQRWFSNTANNYVNGTPYRIRTFTVDDPVAQALDARELRPEHAKTLSAGLVWAHPKFGAEIDFYRVDLSDRLILSSNFLGSAVSTFLAGRGISGVTGARFFSNDAATRTEGFDATLHATVEPAAGHRLRLRAAYNRNLSRMTHAGPIPSGLAAVGITTPLIDLAEEIRLTRAQPHDNLRLSAAWQWQRLTAQLGVTRYGEVETVALTGVTPDQIAALTPGYRVRVVTRTLPQAPASEGGGPQVGTPLTATDVVQIFDAKWIADLSFKARLTDTVSLSLGASNLFDVYPTRNIASRVVNGRAYTGNDNGGTTPYSTTSPFGFNGTFYYSRLDLQF